MTEHETQATRDFPSFPTSVEPATSADADYVIEAFETALRPFYDGDHRAHARRVLATHLAGGEDRRGLLSARQLLLILREGDVPKGVLNLVFKRQGTCKISPLILHPNTEQNRGLGTVLLQAAERHAAAVGARQLYCTVASRNSAALAFFTESGFAVCGSSDGQYKPGETEVLLRRPIRPLPPGPEDDEVISVTEVTDAQGWREVEELISRTSPWQLTLDPLTGPDSLQASRLASLGLDPAERRTAKSYSARSLGGKCRAAVIVAAKKGGALKVLAVGAEDLAAFRALVVDLPSQVAGRGRKLFMHLPPDGARVSVLQEAGWRFEAHLPDAYHPGVVTEQWAYPLESENRMKLMRIHRRYLRLIAEGQKTLEIRVGYDSIKRIHPGDTLKLMSQNESLVRQVAAVRKYTSFEEMLKKEPLQRALPGMTEAEALRQLRQFYPPEKERLGVYVLELSDQLADSRLTTLTND